MKVFYMSQGHLKEIGTIRLHEDKAVIDFGEHGTRLFDPIYWKDKEYTPADGIKYMRILVEKFSMSSTVVLNKESDDTWVKDKK